MGDAVTPALPSTSSQWSRLPSLKAACGRGGGGRGRGQSVGDAREEGRTAPHLELGYECHTAPHPLGVGTVLPSGVSQRRPAQGAAEGPELPIVHRRDNYVAPVLCGEGLVRNDRLVRGAPGAGWPVCYEHAASDVG